MFAGYGLSCDGVRQYALSTDFTWPVRTFNTSDGVFTGGAPITIEWWGYVDKSSEADSAVFSLGINQEGSADWWVDALSSLAFSLVCTFFGSVSVASCRAALCSVS